MSRYGSPRLALVRRRDRRRWVAASAVWSGSVISGAVEITAHDGWVPASAGALDVEAFTVVLAVATGAITGRPVALMRVCGFLATGTAAFRAVARALTARTGVDLGSGGEPVAAVIAGDPACPACDPACPPGDPACVTVDAATLAVAAAVPCWAAPPTATTPMPEATATTVLNRETLRRVASRSLAMASGSRQGRSRNWRSREAAAAIDGIFGRRGTGSPGVS